MTVYVYLPYFILTFFLEYLFNIQKLFMVCTNEAAYTGCRQDNTKGFYQNNRTDLIWPIEVSVFVFNILSMSVLIRTQDNLKVLRERFRSDVFEKLTRK